jgi:diacylglycerol kinase (ATP)
MTNIQGPLRYLLAAILTILKRPSCQATLLWNNSEYSGSLTLVSVGNSNRTGGMFYMTPNAIPDDGGLDFIYAPALTRRGMFRLLPQTIKGTHISNQAIHEHRTSHLKIRCDPGYYHPS